LKTIIVNNIFQSKGEVPFPYQQGETLEEYAFQYFSTNNVNTELIYLPIFWTSYHHFKRENKWKELEIYYNQLLKEYKGSKFFTITQLSKQIPIKGHLAECLKFGASGIGDIPIPLLCQPHTVHKKENPRYKVCFVGRLDTHNVRQDLFNLYSDRKDFCFDNGNNKLFRSIMDNSIFCLCPRGTGKTSYRLYESLQMGCIPIYIYDDKWLPFQNIVKWKDISILLHVDKIKNLGTIIDNISDQQIKQMQCNIYKSNQHFTFKGCCDNIKTILENF